MKTKLVMPGALAALLCGCGGSTEKSAPEPARALIPKITMFYASPPQARPGEPVKLCYGVEGASDVRLEPSIEQIAPSLSRCIEFKAGKTGEYKLIARGASGEEVTQSVRVVVSGAPYRPASGPSGGGEGGLIQTFAAASSSAGPGQQVTLCYVVAAGATGEVSPGGGALRGPKGCLTVQPKQTTTYTLRVTAGGKTETQTVKVRVGP